MEWQKIHCGRHVWTAEHRPRAHGPVRLVYEGASAAPVSDLWVIEQISENSNTCSTLKRSIKIVLEGLLNVKWLPLRGIMKP